jgi:hypothetical protein
MGVLCVSIASNSRMTYRMKKRTRKKLTLTAPNVEL